MIHTDKIFNSSTGVVTDEVEQLAKIYGFSNESDRNAHIKKVADFFEEWEKKTGPTGFFNINNETITNDNIDRVIQLLTDCEFIGEKFPHKINIINQIIIPQGQVPSEIYHAKMVAKCKRGSFAGKFYQINHENTSKQPYPSSSLSQVFKDVKKGSFFNDKHISNLGEARKEIYNKLCPNTIFTPLEVTAFQHTPDAFKEFAEIVTNSVIKKGKVAVLSTSGLQHYTLLAKEILKIALKKSPQTPPEEILNQISYGCPKEETAVNNLYYMGENLTKEQKKRADAAAKVLSFSKTLKNTSEIFDLMLPSQTVEGLLPDSTKALCKRVFTPLEKWVIPTALIAAFAGISLIWKKSSKSIQ